MIVITPLYAAILTLVYLVLSFRVIGVRRSAKIGLGDGGSALLTRRLRAHGNFAEYVPLGLILMMLAEIQDKPDWLLHVLGIVLLSGRLVHALGVSREPEDYRIRTTRMILTFFALITGALSNLGLGGFASLVAAT